MKNYEEKRIERKHKGFTLVELVVVVAIVAVLAVIAVPRFVSMTEGSKVATMEQNHGVLRTAITMYMADNNGKPPAALADASKYVADLTAPTGTVTGDWVENHFKDKPKGAEYKWVATTNAGVVTGGTLTSIIDVSDSFDATDRAGKKTGNAGAHKYEVTFTP